MSDYRFHSPNAIERAFLRIVTSGYPQLAEQIETCEVDDFDTDGYCDVRVNPRPPLATSTEVRDGPSLADGPNGLIETLLWIKGGYLASIEVIPSFGGQPPLRDIYERFIEAASHGQLLYK
ncbi:MAG: hypothetical protein ACREM6_03610 [Vulcanimicrobiaceae bacterium]